MFTIRRATKALLLAAAVLAATAVAAFGLGYLHVANAQSYAVNHVWVSSPCNQSSAKCWRYPYATGWYERINNNKVRVEIAVGIAGHSKLCTRVFAVIGDDNSPSVTSNGSSPYYYCPE